MVMVEAKLLSRRSAAIARVGHSSLISASRAPNVGIWDVEGKCYVDFAGGVAVVNTSHCHPRIMAAVRTDHGEVGHVNAFQIMQDHWQGGPGFRVRIDVELAGGHRQINDLRQVHPSGVTDQALATSVTSVQT